jgi:hypothetical protein
MRERCQAKRLFRGALADPFANVLQPCVVATKSLHAFRDPAGDLDIYSRPRWPISISRSGARSPSTTYTAHRSWSRNTALTAMIDHRYVDGWHVSKAMTAFCDYLAASERCEPALPFRTLPGRAGDRVFRA